jgi:hypothetical protein
LSSDILYDRVVTGGRVLLDFHKGYVNLGFVLKLGIGQLFRRGIARGMGVGCWMRRDGRFVVARSLVRIRFGVYSGVWQKAGRGFEVDLR